MATFQKGQLIKGVRHSYRLLGAAHPRTTTVWIANVEQQSASSILSLGQYVWTLFRPPPPAPKVIIKTAKQPLLDREAANLDRFRGHRNIRQMLDRIESPAALVLEYMDIDLATLVRKRLEAKDVLKKHEIKNVARQVLEALVSISSENLVHTDLKSMNVLLSGFESSATSSTGLVKVADLANVFPPMSHQISPPAFRPPESWLGLPWGPPADIWSFGVMIANLLMGPFADFMGAELVHENEDGDFREMLQKQHFITGPFPQHMIKQAGGDAPELFELFTEINNNAEKPMTWDLYMEVQELSSADSAFLREVLRMDPDERPTAKQLLQNPWLSKDI